MKTKTRLLLIVSIMGLVLAMAGFNDTMLFFKGDTVNLSGDYDDFSHKALAEGEINFVYGPFAVLEETQKRYGITTSRTETDFYIVGNLDTDFFIVYSAVNKNMIGRLDDASDQWINYFIDESISEYDYPVISIPFKGKVAYQYSGNDYQSYFDEAIDDLGYFGIERSQIVENMRIIDGEVTITSVIIFFAGAGLALLGIIILIAGFVSARKRRQSEELY